MIRFRALLAGLSAVALVAVTASCGDNSNPTDVGADRSPPRVQLASVTAAADSILSFTVNVTDNLGIKSVHIALSGGVTASFDTTFTSAQTNVTLPFNLVVPNSVPPGTRVTVTASAFDGAGNQSSTQTLALTVGRVPESSVVITSPTTGTPVIIGKSIIVAVSGKSAVKVRVLGLALTGVITRRDSVIFTSPLRDSLAIADTIQIPANVQPGTLTLTPFLVDSLGQLIVGAVPVNLVVSRTSTTPPTVVRGHTSRIEVTDTLHVEGSSPGGITLLGYQIHNISTNATIVGDSVSSSGNFTSLIKTFTMKLPITQFPSTVTIVSFATDANGTRTSVTDTVVVVAGVTRAPFGGVVADAIYHARSNAIYLSNIERNQLEVFSLADSSFHSAIVVGSRPWGIAGWPRDRTGTIGDTLLVANSGGTEISYVNTISQAEVSRYYLPNIVAYSVTTVLSTLTGQPIPQRTVYDFSDRPQYLAATCQTAGYSAGVTSDTTAGLPCGDVVLVYSTTPTGGQTLPFPNQGTVRWENLTRRMSHFFFEQAIGQTQGRLDTLEIERYQSSGYGSDSTLVPNFVIDTVIDGGGVPRAVTGAIVVDVPRMGFRDTTFVRGAGNFRRAVIGEGGSVLGSRGIEFDVTRGFAPFVLTSPTGFSKIARDRFIDLGISRAFDVSDYVANTFAKVQGVAINFDGQLAAVRADSTYIINPTLRLLGLLQTTAGGNSGFDFHPNNAGIQSFPLSTRLAFAASTQPEIEIYDTWCYRKVGTIPTRDPIIGPIKAAIRQSTGEIVIVGATQFGVVIATLPNSFSTTCP